MTGIQGLQPLCWREGRHNTDTHTRTKRKKKRQNHCIWIQPGEKNESRRRTRAEEEQRRRQWRVPVQKMIFFFSFQILNQKENDTAAAGRNNKWQIVVGDYWDFNVTVVLKWFLLSWSHFWFSKGILLLLSSKMICKIKVLNINIFGKMIVLQPQIILIFWLIILTNEH